VQGEDFLCLNTEGRPTNSRNRPTRNPLFNLRLLPSRCTFANTLLNPTWKEKLTCRQRHQRIVHFLFPSSGSKSAERSYGDSPERHSKRLKEKPETVSWRELYRLTNEDGSLRDVFRICTDEQLSKEGYRLLWFHSQGKEESDAATRARRLQRAIRELTDLRVRLGGPRTRFRQQAKVAEAVDAILDSHSARDFLRVEIKEQQIEKYRQASRGRPTKNTKYKREVELRFDVSWEVDGKQLELAVAGDGVFPLITNLKDWKAADVLQAYKRQPMIEKRFSQLKTDFRVAPVYLKSATRIVGLLAIYFFVLMVQSLLERELRKAMASQGVDSLPLYPEGRACVRVTTRQVLDVFEPISRHTISKVGSNDFEMFSTELAPIHRMILKLLRVPEADYRT
jgi:hypothetical protein